MNAAPKSKAVTIGIGILFVSLGILIVATAENGVLSYLAALVVGGLGIDAIYSAIRGRRSLLSRIGPMP
jgi:hypothetical protein